MSLHMDKYIDAMSPPTSNPEPRCVGLKPPDKALWRLSSYPVSHRPNLAPTPVVIPTQTPTKFLNAFSLLMSCNRENESWKESTEAENSKLTFYGKNKKEQEWHVRQGERENKG